MQDKQSVEEVVERQAAMEDFLKRPPGSPSDFIKQLPGKDWWDDGKQAAMAAVFRLHLPPDYKIRPSDIGRIDGPTATLLLRKCGDKQNDVRAALMLIFQ